MNTRYYAGGLNTPSQPRLFRPALLPGVLFVVWAMTLAGEVRARSSAPGLYGQYCAGCHGSRFGTDDPREWLMQSRQQASASDIRYARIIADGDDEAGMPAFGDTLDKAQIRALVVLLREHISDQAHKAADASPGADDVFVSEEHSFVIETVAKARGVLWSMDFLPDNSILMTEKSGVLYHYTPGSESLKKINGTPAVWSRGQGGLLDVLVHPDYSTNGWIYLAYSDKDSGMTAVTRGRISDDRWTSAQTIFRADEQFRSTAGVHFGTRMVAADGYLYFGIGDRGRQNQAQDLSRPNGKIHRIFDDGRVPADNPFVDTENAYATIWTYGNRNPQGLTLAPDGSLWEAEHGPRGGDEINVIKRGRNYGWPLVSFGINYNGTPLAETTERAGIDNPLWHWTPSIAVSNIDFYEGTAFSGWHHNLLVASLGLQELHRLTISDGQVTAGELLVKNQGRIRDVRSGPDGLVYLLVEQDGNARLMRMRPTATADNAGVTGISPKQDKAPASADDGGVDDSIAGDTEAGDTE
ncbi:MAG: PQQ-dependent sugar dehydrogenase [Gammaproteobacteria bacterium]|nr:PQQ-dependent sugar dehydrogenase [Gammaproteobacteria bacterium]